MLKGIIVSVFAFVGCLADSPPQGIYCSEIPDVIYTCLNNPRVIKAEISVKCQKPTSECEKMTCIFRESGWLNGDKVNKNAVSDYFTQFSTSHPAWSPAVTHVKAACLGEHDVPPQGVDLNCPAYDVMHCVLTGFIRNATPSQWKSTPECQYPRSYAAACPVCPTSCFASQVPNGACNACLSLPRSA